MNLSLFSSHVLDCPSIESLPQLPQTKSPRPTHYHERLPILEDDEPPSSPFLPSLSALPDLETDDDASDIFSSPSLRSFSSLPELDADDTFSSPSLRTFSSLPDLDDGADPDESSPPSPGHFMLALPGAEPDHDLIPEHDDAPQTFIPALSIYTTHYPKLSRSSLLLLDDPPDTSPPRSPSPELADDLDASSLAECPDPDLPRLLELKRRAQLAVRSAKQLEKKMVESGAVQMGAEARRVRKKEKERSKEITALLKLKLRSDEKSALQPTADSAEPDLDGQVVDGLGGTASLKRAQSMKLNRAGKCKTPKTVISSMAQLVARMMLRRHETVRSLSNGNPPSAKLSSWSDSHRRSPLSNELVVDGHDPRDDDTAVAVSCDPDSYFLVSVTSPCLSNISSSQ